MRIGKPLGDLGTLTSTSSPLDPKTKDNGDAHASVTLNPRQEEGTPECWRPQACHESEPSQREQSKQELTLAEFVERRFVPEYVSTKCSAGQAHIHAMLKHVLTPEAVNKAFGISDMNPRLRLRSVPGWPYLDAVRLGDLHPMLVHNVISVALDHGYSTQTASHIRNVIRQVFSHASKVMCFRGQNPANCIATPPIEHRPTHVLSLNQFRLLIRNMRFPEREIVVMGMLTNMTVAEICGLQWKYVNLSKFRLCVDGEWLPPGTIFVTTQSYRGELLQVRGSRRRQLPIGEMLFSVLRSLGNRPRSRRNDVFVFSSRNGTPVNQDNLALRRLKAIGKRLGMPWISWNVFRCTNMRLTAQYGDQIHNEYKKWLPLELIYSQVTQRRTQRVSR